MTSNVNFFIICKLVHKKQFDNIRALQMQYCVIFSLFLVLNCNSNFFRYCFLVYFQTNREFYTNKFFYFTFHYSITILWAIKFITLISLAHIHTTFKYIKTLRMFIYIIFLVIRLYFLNFYLQLLTQLCNSNSDVEFFKYFGFVYFNFIGFHE